jgi:hypothetical protein
MPARTKAGFVEPMLLLRTDRLPDDPARWAYQLKFDGYRAVAFKVGGKVHLRSCNDKDFNALYPAVVRGLAKLPSDTAIDGELIALGDDGRPSFNALQNVYSGEHDCRRARPVTLGAELHFDAGSGLRPGIRVTSLSADETFAESVTHHACSHPQTVTHGIAGRRSWC